MDNVSHHSPKTNQELLKSPAWSQDDHQWEQISSNEAPFYSPQDPKDESQTLSEVLQPSPDGSEVDLQNIRLVLMIVMMLGLMNVYWEMPESDTTTDFKSLKSQKY